jgi:FMN phosphatase YigB (HAD superfamily)
MYKLLTVDIWDTLLRRDCHPECIKLATARHLLLTRTDNLKSAYQNQWSLYHARIDTESLLAVESRSLGRDDEYEITDVLSRWLETVSECMFDSSVAHYLAEYELQVEIARSFPDQGIEDFLKVYPAERTFFLSDFYMNAERLGRLLEAKGLRYLVPEGISSCDIGFNKRSGRLYTHVHELYRLSPEEHVHVGDNPWSDVDSAKRIGVTAIHYLPASRHTERLERDRLFSSRGALFEHVRAVCNTKAYSACAGEHADMAAFRLGIEASSLFIGFALWVAEKAVIRKLDKICFLTREGEFFLQVFSLLFPRQQHFGHQLPVATLFEVSRLSTFAASLRVCTLGEVSRLWSVFKSQSVSGLFATLGLDIEKFLETLDRLGLHPSDVIENPSENSSLKKLFEIPEFVEALNYQVDTQKSLLRDYLAQQGLNSVNRIGIVDIGWRGTIQDNLAHVVPQAHFHGMYLGLRRFDNAQPGNVSKEAYGPNENISSELNQLFEVFSALEMICSSPYGSVVGYLRDGDRVVCQREISVEENLAYESFSADFQRGVLFATDHWRPYLEAYVVTAAELRDSALKVWETLRHSPGKSLASVFMQSPQHDVFGFNELFARSQVPPIITILLAPINSSKRRELIAFIRRVQWSAAIENLQNIGRFHRISLLITFRIANQIKLLRMKLRHSRSRSNA